MGRAIQRYSMDMHDEPLLMDYFAGGGGGSLAMELAHDRPVDIAINHDPEAIVLHRANHPMTKHYREDVFRRHPLAITQSRRVMHAHFSPDCTHHSRAKGGTPVSNKRRGLAWIVVDVATWARPDLITLENVPEFEEWGPLCPVLDKEGNVKCDGNDKPFMKPDPARLGETFQEWVSRLRRLGYKVDWRVLKACDYGAPTIRKRLFVVARCDGLPIIWPKPTNGPGLKPYRTAAECIDWSIHCPSIFERKKSLAENTLKRIARGIQRFVIDTADPFFITYDVSKSENRIDLATPFIVPIANYNGQVIAHDIKDPLRTITANPKGGSFSLIVPHIQRDFSQSVGSSIDSPIGSITAGGSGKAALVTTFLTDHLETSHLVEFRGSSKYGRDVRKPFAAIMAAGQHVGEVRAFLVKYYGTATAQDIKDPLHTITAKDRLGLVAVHGVDYQIIDIGMRMLSPRELFRAQDFPDSYVIDPKYRAKDKRSGKYKTKTLSKTAQVRMCGNSVPPGVLKALIRENMLNEQVVI